MVDQGRRRLYQADGMGMKKRVGDAIVDLGLIAGVLFFCAGLYLLHNLAMGLVIGGLVLSRACLAIAAARPE